MWVEVVAVGLVVVVAVWMALFLLARVMPPGRTREYVAFAPNCVILLGRLRRDSRLPWRSRVSRGLPPKSRLLLLCAL